MNNCSLQRRLFSILAVLALLALAHAAPASAAERKLRVCADPNNLPFSNEAGEGFENKLAELIARELQAELSYFWWAQRRGFVRNTLNAGACDLVMGVPAGYELVETTLSYYRSAYVYVYRSDSGLDLRSLRDPRLHKLRIGVHLIGDDGVNTPPAHALGELNIVDNVVGYTIYGDYRKPNPPARIIDAVVNREIDVAAVWGPLGGYFTSRSGTSLTAVPIADAGEFTPMRFEFSIAMGVRKGETAFRNELNAILERENERIRMLLRDYGVPLVEEETR